MIKGITSEADRQGNHQADAEANIGAALQRVDLKISNCMHARFYPLDYRENTRCHERTSEGPSRCSEVSGFLENGTGPAWPASLRGLRIFVYFETKV